VLIVFAWFFDVFGVVFGAANSLYVTFGDPEVRPWPKTIIAFFPAAPLMVLAAGELLRIPMAKAFHLPRGLFLKGLALASFIGLWCIGVENWTFGIERMVALRLKPAEDLRLDIRQAEVKIADRAAEVTRVAEELKARREVLNNDITIAEASLKEKADRSTAEDKAHEANLLRIRDHCMVIREICLKPQTDAENLRYKLAKEDIQAEQKDVATTVATARAGLKAANEAANQPITGPTAAALENELMVKRDKLANEVKDNSIHRIAASWYNVNGEALTDQQLAKAKNFFSLFGAIIISGIAGAAAFIHYAPPTKPWIKRTVRGLVARLRKGVVRTEVKEVPKIVKVDVPGPALKEVPVLIKETTIKIVPVRGLQDEQQPFTILDKVTGAEADAKLRVIRGARS
jgi:hypothetical protein